MPSFTHRVVTNITQIATRLLADTQPVTISSPADKQILTYVAVSSDWRNKNPPPGATKEFFMHPIRGTELLQDGNYGGYRMDAATESCHITFFIPANYSSLTAIALVVDAFATATHRLNFDWSAAGNGQTKDTHTGFLYDVDIALTDDVITEIDLSTMSNLSLISANDYFGLYISGDTVNVLNLLVIGLRFKYA